ncbi:hypothetical protein [Sphingosinicella microcystinivorans]|uniref:Catalytic LigB subunit of aromatic ring-opening dioxygenase n=1 Tax=Sphingosinicella microcystinivorans TaxID=335406 RepID=A0AAD1D418_SPHMI|nr:hypothetical protein [Sphingosinicella microcystinivorans]RKS85440.1 catalytic LigB subunit of aromatic ring-opening dioxygenase [Sphingosinicella microcystinivorans]BBE33270.1 hypothetical protein SmB9_09280 [Sphingosinicella microcystinivorans]
MATIVLGAATSHGPMLALPAKFWVERAQDEMKSDARMMNTLDGRRLTYAELYRERGDRHRDDIDLATFEKKEALCRSALDRLRADIEAARPDVILLIGNDQNELFAENNVPSLAVFHGDAITTHPRDTSRMPEWRVRVTRDYGMDWPRSYPVDRKMAEYLVGGLMDAGFDVSALGSVPEPEKLGLGHAHGYVLERFFDGSPPPVVPVFINTFTPLHPMRPGRCLALGRVLRQLVEADGTSRRVAIIASGGLSHFICEEEFDREFLALIAAQDWDALAAIPEAKLSAGTSENRSWLVLAGAMHGRALVWQDYVPIPRTPAGSGQGMGWSVWS